MIQSNISLKKVFQDKEPKSKIYVNKSHAACYAVVAFQTAYLKKYYPEEFMAALLTSVIGNNKKLPQYCNSCQKTIGIDIVTPDVNESEAGFATVNKKIRFGLEAVSAVGSVVAREIMEEREANGPYKSLFDFALRLNGKGLNKKAVENLIKSGAFDFTGYNRAELLNAYQMIMDAAKQEAANNASGQVSLFDFMEDTPEDFKCPPIKRMAKLPEEIKLKYERDVTSLYISGHPLNKHTKAMAVGNCVSIREIEESFENNDGRFSNKQQVNVAAIMFDTKRKLTKSGTMMIQGTIQDVDSEASMIAFSRALETYDFLFKDEEVVLIKANIDLKDDGSVTFIANALYSMPQNDAAEEAFEAFKKEVLPRQYNKPKPQYERVEQAVPRKSDSKFRPGIYLKMAKKASLTEYADVLKTAVGQTPVYIWCEEDQKIYHNPSLKINIHDKDVIRKIKVLVGGPENIKLY